MLVVCRDMNHTKYISDQPKEITGDACACTRPSTEPNTPSSASCDKRLHGQPAPHTRRNSDHSYPSLTAIQYNESVQTRSRHNHNSDRECYFSEKHQNKKYECAKCGDRVQYKIYNENQGLLSGIISYAVSGYVKITLCALFLALVLLPNSSCIINLINSMIKYIFLNFKIHYILHFFTTTKKKLYILS